MKIKNTILDFDYNYTYIPNNEDDENSALYFGEYKDEAFDGLGLLSWPDSTFYMGMFKKGDQHGPGLLYQDPTEVTLSTFDGWDISGGGIVFDSKKSIVYLYPDINNKDEFYKVDFMNGELEMSNRDSTIDVPSPERFNHGIYFTFDEQNDDNFDYLPPRESTADGNPVIFAATSTSKNTILGKYDPENNLKSIRRFDNSNGMCVVQFFNEHSVQTKWSQSINKKLTIAFHHVEYDNDTEAFMFEITDISNNRTYYYALCANNELAISSYDDDKRIDKIVYSLYAENEESEENEDSEDGEDSPRFIGQYLPEDKENEEGYYITSEKLVNNPDYGVISTILKKDSMILANTDCENEKYQTHLIAFNKKGKLIFGPANESKEHKNLEFRLFRDEGELQIATVDEDKRDVEFIIKPNENICLYDDEKEKVIHTWDIKVEDYVFEWECNKFIKTDEEWTLTDKGDSYYNSDYNAMYQFIDDKKKKTTNLVFFNKQDEINGFAAYTFGHGVLYNNIARDQDIMTFVYNHEHSKFGLWSASLLSDEKKRLWVEFELSDPHTLSYRILKSNKDDTDSETIYEVQLSTDGSYEVTIGDEEPKSKPKKSSKSSKESKSTKKSQSEPKVQKTDPEEALEKLIGLTSVKKELRRMRAFIVKNKNKKLDLHMAFTGNPGTGKTVVARLMAEIFQKYGVLPKSDDPLVETDRSGLVGEYIGHTEKKVAEKLKESMGKVLFIDEAYDLADGSSNDSSDFGKKAIGLLIKSMEDHQGEFSVILAGYTKEMNKMISSNPGFKSRITMIDFPNYTRSELKQIAQKMLSDDYAEYSIDDKTLDMIIDIVESTRNQKDFANARSVRKAIKKIVMIQNERTEKDLGNYKILPEDIEVYKKEYSSDINNKD